MSHAHHCLSTHWTAHTAPQEMEDFGRERGGPGGNQLHFASHTGLDLLENKLVPKAIISYYTPMYKNKKSISFYTIQKYIQTFI